MSSSSSARSPARRSDAARNFEAILDAAVVVLRDNADAGIEAIAAAAGISRQTVYAHFASRDALVRAVLDRATEEVTQAMHAVDPEDLSPTDAVLRLLDVSWEVFEHYPFLMARSGLPVTGEDDQRRHVPIVGVLGRIVERGQSSGEFTRAQTSEWLVAAIVALGHAAGEAAGHGRTTALDARAALRTSVLRLLVA